MEILDISSPTIRYLKYQLSPAKGKFSVSKGEKCRVGVFATLATVRSEYFKKEINRLGGTEVHEVACHQLVDVIENASSLESIRARICLYVDQLHHKFSGFRPHFVVLGCTHYSVVRDLFREALGEDCEILSQEHLLIEHMLDLDMLPIRTSTPSVRRLLTTGDKNKANKAAGFLSDGNLFDFEHLQLKRR